MIGGLRLFFSKNFKNSKKQQKPSYFKINIPVFQRNSQTPVLFNMLPKFFLGQFHMFRIWEKYWHCVRLPPATFFFFFFAKTQNVEKDSKNQAIFMLSNHLTVTCIVSYIVKNHLKTFHEAPKNIFGVFKLFSESIIKDEYKFRKSKEY